MGFAMPVTAFFTPLLLVYQVFLQDYFFEPELWVAYMHSGNLAYSLFLSFQLFVNIILLLFSITFAVLFFQRRTSVPKLVWLKYAAHFVLLTVLMLFGAYFVEEVEYTDRDWLDIAKVVIGGVIWIWYFSVSRRVGETFVKSRAKKVRESESDLSL